VVDVDRWQVLHILFADGQPDDIADLVTALNGMATS